MTTYYVSLAGSNANDGLDTDHPFATFAKVLTVAQSGDVVHFAAGDYTGIPIDIPQNLALTLTSDNAGVDPDGLTGWSFPEVKLDRIVTQSSITVDGIHVHFTIGGNADTTSSNGLYWQGLGTGYDGLSVTVRNSIFSGAGSGDLAPQPQPFGLNLQAEGTNVTVEHVHFGEFTGFPDDETQYGIYINHTTASATVTITDNVFETNSPRNSAIGFDSQPDEATIIITGNSFEDPGTSAGAIKFMDWGGLLVGEPAQSFPGIADNTMSGAGAVVANVTGTVTIVDTSSESVVGTGADETFVATGGNDTIDGGGNTAVGDTLDMSAAGAGSAVVDLQGGYAVSTATGIDEISNIENVRGGAGNDLLKGNDDDNVFYASGGTDIIDGRGSSAHGDTFDASDASAALAVNLSATSGSVSGAFTASLKNIENVKTGSGNDTITLSNAANAVDGGGSVDTAITSDTYGAISISWSGTPGSSGTFHAGADALAAVEKLQTSDKLVWLVDSEDDLVDALAGASSGDVIVLAPGEYDMNITLESGVDILGLSEADVVINGAIIVPAGLTDVTVKGLTVHNASSSGYLLDMRAASNSTITDVAFENVTFELVSDFQASGPGTNSNDSPIGNSFARGTITMADGSDTDTAGLTFKNVTMDSNGHNVAGGEALAVFQVAGKVVMDNVHVVGTVDTNLGAQLNISGNGANDSIDFVNGGTSGGGNLYISSFEHVLVDNNIFTNQGLALNGAKDATVTDNTFQNISTITANGTQHRGLTIEDAWGTDGVNGLTVTGNTFLNISAEDGAIAFQRWTTGGTATIDKLSHVTIGDNTFTNVDTPIHTNDAYFGAGAVLPADFEGDHLVLATGGDDDLDGTTGADIIFADAGDDTVTAGTGNDTIDGGAGEDDVVYGGALTTASFSYVGGVWKVTGADGTDTLEGVERVTDINGKVFLLVGHDGTDGFEHIQDAVDAAVGGETILIAPGTYTETSEYVPGDYQGLHINTANLTLVGFRDDTGVAVASAEEARDHGPTVISGAQNMFTANHWIDVGGTGTVIVGLHLQAGVETDSKLLEIWADNTSVTDSFLDVYEGGVNYTYAIAVYYNEDGTHEVESYTLSDNILNEGVMVANGVGDTGVAANQKITGNTFVSIGSDRYDTVTLQGQVNGVGWLLTPIGLPTITGNTLDGNTAPFLLRLADDNLSTNLDLSYIEAFLANNTTASTTYAYALTDSGDLRIAPRSYEGAPASENYYVMNSIDSLNLALDVTPDDVFGGQRITQQAGDTIVVQSGSGAVDSQIMVDDLTIKATANSIDLDLTLATKFADNTNIPAGGVKTITLADYSTGFGANVDVTGNGLDNSITGNSGANSLTGGAGSDTITGGAGNDTIDGGGDNDTLDGGTGNNTIVGGGGSDTVLFSGNINQYGIIYDSGTYTLTKVSTGEVNTVTGVEKFVFGSTLYDVTSNTDLILNKHNPTFSTGVSGAVNENVTNAIVYDADASDLDGDSIFGPIVYSIDNVQDGASFSIESATGVVRLTGSANYELQNSYDIVIRATQGTTSATRNVTISVNDLNDNSPVFTSGPTATVLELAPVATVVYHAQATDADSAANFGNVFYSLAGGTDADAFTIDSATGEVRLKASADFETKTSYAFNVMAAQGATSTTQAVTLNVTNVNEGVALATVEVVVESGTTKLPLGNLASNNALTFDVAAINNGGGHVYLGGTELTTGATGLTLAQLNSLTFSSNASGTIQFTAHSGGDTGTLNVILTVTAAVGKTYNGTNSANYIDAAGGNDKVFGKNGADVLIGGAGNDSIDGGSGNDTIYGGLGKDTLIGGSGSDRFVFDTALGSTNVDVIRSFSKTSDKIWLESDIFTALGGTMDNGEFRRNTSGNAQDANDFIIYESDTGKLFYDADANGAGARVQIATLDKNLTITFANFEII